MWQNLQDIIPKKVILPGSSRLFTLKPIIRIGVFQCQFQNKITSCVCCSSFSQNDASRYIFNWIYHRFFHDIPIGYEGPMLEIQGLILEEQVMPCDLSVISRKSSLLSHLIGWNSGLLLLFGLAPQLSTLVKLAGKHWVTTESPDKFLPLA